MELASKLENKLDNIFTLCSSCLMSLMVQFRVKINKYGDNVLQTIEATVRDYYKSDKTSSSGNDNTDSGKKRRNSINVQNGNSKDEEFFTESTGCTKKRVLKKQNKHAEVIDYRDLGYFDECIDGDLDFDETMMP